jgi:hypothetical protein
MCVQSGYGGSGPRLVTSEYLKVPTVSQIAQYFGADFPLDRVGTVLAFVSAVVVRRT